MRYSELFSPESSAQICDHLNIDSEAPILPRMDWRSYFVGTAKALTAGANEVIAKFGPYLPEESVEWLEEILAGWLLRHLGGLTAMKRIDAGLGVSRFPALLVGGGQLFEADFERILNLIGASMENCRRLGIPPLGFPSQDLVRDDVSPKRGASRIESDGE